MVSMRYELWVNVPVAIFLGTGGLRDAFRLHFPSRKRLIILLVFSPSLLNVFKVKIAKKMPIYIF